MPGPRILIADDDPGMVRLLRATLQGMDECELLEARDGEEALALARTEHPDLIVLDVLMPGRNGFEVSRALKRDPQLQRTPIVLITALRETEEHRFVAGAVGADAFLTKPFSPMELLETVHRLLGAPPGQAG